MIEQIRGQFGRLDILVNNAGVTHWVNLADLDGLTDKIWDEIFDVNVLGTVLLTQAVVPHLPGPRAEVVPHSVRAERDLRSVARRSGPARASREAISVPDSTMVSVPDSIMVSIT